MQGIERMYCNTCINALIGAWSQMLEANGNEALQEVPYGKGDTLGLDATPEITIADRIKAFDQHAILITEELDDQAIRRWPTDADPVKQPLMFFCDPTDGSVPFKRFLEELTKDDRAAKIGHLMRACKPEETWESLFPGPATITAPTTSITCVRKGEIVFSAILSYICGLLYVASDSGVYHYKLKPFDDPSNEGVTLAEVTHKGQRLHFPSVRELGYTHDDCRRFATFLGKSEVYLKNFRDSKLFGEAEKPDKFVHHREPPGPPRPLFLSELQNGHGPVGFILANGEKIGEWMHWLAFVKYAKDGDESQALRAFEVVLERPWTKEGVLMSTSEAYSIFCRSGEKTYLDISRLRNFPRPSQFRCMLVVTRHDNERVIQILQQHQCREVTNFF
ncbi:MAG: hypothetical protein AAB891_00250 [Patescibacteria group bacterium]